MFAQTMVESSWAQRSRRSWATFTSFGAQAVAIAFLLMLPVLKTSGLPSVHPLSTPITLGVPPAIRMVAHHPTGTVVQSNLWNDVLIAPREIPKTVQMIEDVVQPPQVTFDDSDGPGGPANGSRLGVRGAISELITRAVPPPAPIPSVPRTVRLSHMDPGMLIRQVKPQYPEPAKMARIQGKVELAAVISKDGTIENLHVLAGHPMLVRAAIEAVSQWRYRPYILNNEPVEVETQITVNFSLGER